ncbi:S9 family peptidase [Carboxylicivirga mesophila]|uniref:S9 family peptidase n=1 Tax=Carboxylicivirga mesophila TaxID=1166478 RepID=A0ABS5KCF0_9BACT|nr:S9 family peptidase [Carboxylicivirga mesophila]MBS2212013.1 S9 family peptidase [Carboxylicivirga mesophila]
MKAIIKTGLSLALLMCIGTLLHAQNTLTPDELLKLKNSRAVQLHPDGDQLIYAVYTPRTANEAPGGSRTSYILANLKTGESKPLFDEAIKGSSPQWSPDGKHLAFKMRADNAYQIFVLPENATEPIQVSDESNGVNSFEWNPDGTGFAYLSTTPYSAREKELKQRGYDFIYYEENIKNDNLYLIKIDEHFKQTAKVQITENVNVWDFTFDHQGQQLAYAATEQKLIDQRYVFRKIHIYSLETGKVSRVLNNVGKLGNYRFSPDGQQLTYTGALNINDHAVSQVYKVDLADGSIQNLTSEKYKGHVSWADWKNNKEIVYLAHEGVYPKLYTLSLKNNKRNLILDAGTNGVIFGTPLFTPDFKSFAFTGNTPNDISNLYKWDGKTALSKITDINPELAQTTLGKQEVINFTARDGLNIEGLLMKPIGYKEGETYPLIVYVHGGPESHHSNGWLTGYSTPGQVMAGKGYLVAYFNYRASTGYGVDFAMEGFEDPAGKEFDDLADGIDYLVENYGADRNRVGMAGGSYGGFASAWFATYYTDYIKAAAVFVGITNIISKKGTTDIAYEELYVHSGQPLEKQWEMNLKRSPVYHAHKSKTATLIYGGAADPRIHPSQSMELYRRMKMNDHPAVRLVQYPGEGHGNRKQVGRIDVLYRQIGWMDWYVKDLQPLDGPMPPLEISDKYGLDWDF